MKIVELNKDDLTEVSGGRVDNEKRVAYIYHDSCLLCDSCINVCEKQAIYTEFDDVEHVEKYIVNAGRCNGCGECVNECPADCITLN